MSRKLSLWLLAAAALGVVVLGSRRERPKESPAAEVAAAAPTVSPVVGTRPGVPEAAAAAGAARALAPDGEAGLAALPPEDVEWVLDAVARTESARTLSANDREELIAQLASVRMHAVLERTEPMAVEPSEVAQ